MTTQEAVLYKNILFCKEQYCMVTTLRIYLNSNRFLLTERGDRKPWECKFNLNSFVQFFTFESCWFFA